MSVQNSFYVPVLWKALWRMYSECYVWLCLCVCVGRQAGRQDTVFIVIVKDSRRILTKQSKLFLSLSILLHENTKRLCLN